MARYHRADLAANLPVSTEITGYALAGFCYLFELTGREEYLEAARRAGNFLTQQAWDATTGTMPFELSPGGRYSYFFDCGIIARALLWLWRLDGKEENLAVARGLGQSLDRDFRSLSAFHPIILLPCKSPDQYTLWWSRMPGAFQLKAALAWKDLAEETGEAKFAALYEEMLAFSLKRYSETLDNEPLDNETGRPKLMDRLHAWSYFLEGLQPVREREAVKSILAAALERGETLLEELSSVFLRSDACAQLMRIRLLAGGPVSPASIERLAQFQWHSEDARLHGCFAFGSRNGERIPHANPVSTVFALQALHMTQQESLQHNLANFDWRKLI